MPEPAPPRGEVTLILQQVSAAARDSLAGPPQDSPSAGAAPEGTVPGPPSAESVRGRLFELVYEELRRIAGALMRRERPGRTLQPTALVHEAYLKLVDATSLRWNDRAHFLGIAARAMRMILIDHARASSAAKRGGDWQRVTLVTGDGAVDAAAFACDRETELMDLNDALERLGRLDERAAQVAEMRLFAGMTVRETAEALGISPRSVDDDWATARAWLSRELRGDTPA